MISKFWIKLLLRRLEFWLFFTIFFHHIWFLSEDINITHLLPHLITYLHFDSWILYYVQNVITFSSQFSPLSLLLTTLILFNYVTLILFDLLPGIDIRIKIKMFCYSLRLQVIKFVRKWMIPFKLSTRFLSKILYYLFFLRYFLFFYILSVISTIWTLFLRKLFANSVIWFL